MLRLLKVLSVSPTAGTRKDEGSATPLQLAVTYGYLDVVEWLWTRPEVRSNTKAASEAMLTAAKAGQVEVLQLLLKKPTPLDVNYVEDEGGPWSSLMWAASRAHLEVVELLLLHGASCTLRPYESSALHEAVKTDRWIHD